MKNRCNVEKIITFCLLLIVSIGCFGQKHDEVLEQWRDADLAAADTIISLRLRDSSFSIFAMKGDDVISKKEYLSNGEIVTEKYSVKGVSISLRYWEDGYLLRSLGIKLPHDTISRSYEFSNDGFLIGKQLKYNSGLRETFDYNKEGELIFRMNSVMNYDLKGRIFDTTTYSRTLRPRIGFYLRKLGDSVNQTGYIDENGKGVITFLKKMEALIELSTGVTLRLKE
jgi:hypothetical protein